MKVVVEILLLVALGVVVFYGGCYFVLCWWMVMRTGRSSVVKTEVPVALDRTMQKTVHRRIVK